MPVCTSSRITPDIIGVTSGEKDPTYFIDDTLGTVPAVPVGNCLEDVPIRCTLVSKMACLFRRESGTSRSPSGGCCGRPYERRGYYGYAGEEMLLSLYLFIRIVRTLRVTPLRWHLKNNFKYWIRSTGFQAVKAETTQPTHSKRRISASTDVE
jgi:hypothetical protein